MSRPKPIIIFSNIDKDNNTVQQILKGEGVFAVFYDNEPINLKITNRLVNYPTKYKKTTFTHSGHAFNLAEKLNKTYNTDKFTVVKMSDGTVINENKKLPL
jgi:hypothetical protein